MKLAIFESDVMKKFDPNATYVDLSGCTSLAEVPAFPNATHVDLSGCTSLTEVPAFPNATHVDLSGCTEAIEAWRTKRLVPLLTATGKEVSQVIEKTWKCHNWSNCPMHEVFGVSSVAEVPVPWRGEAAIFVSLFDARLLKAPLDLLAK